MPIKRFPPLLFVVAILFSVDYASAEHPRKVTFAAKQFAYPYQDFILPYREAVINEAADSSAILVVLLHSRHSCGNANDAHLTADGVGEVTKFLQKSGRRAILLVPQCPEGREWNERNSRAGFSMSDVIKELIRLYSSGKGVDTTRIYLLGASMGGSGVWRLASEDPQCYAAAMAAASNPRGIKSRNLLQIPFLAVVGSQDRMVDPERIVQLIETINRQGGESKVAVLKGYSHGATCRSAFSEEHLGWLFDHQR